MMVGAGRMYNGDVGVGALQTAPLLVAVPDISWHNCIVLYCSEVRCRCIIDG